MGDGVYATEAEWRAITGFTTIEVSSDDFSTFISLAEQQLKVDAFRFQRHELVYRHTLETGDRYYVSNRYFADANLDDDVTIADIEVFEYDTTAYVDISSQVASIDVPRGFFTLSDGYPTNNRSVLVNYYYASRPHEEIRHNLKMASLFYTTYLVLKRIRNNNTKAGMTSYSIGDMSITKTQQDFDKQLNEELAKYREQVDYIKPLRVIGFTEGRIAEYRDSLYGGYRRRIVDSLAKSRFTRYGAFAGGRFI